VTIVNQSAAHVWSMWLRMKVDHFWPRPRGRCAGRYLATVLGETSWPSFASSPAIRSSLQSGFSVHIRRIRARVSASIGGRPRGRGERRRQRSFHRERCHRRTVSGRTMVAASKSAGKTPLTQATARRSRALSPGCGADRRRTMSYWRRRAFSASRAARERSIPSSAARRLVIRSRIIAAEYQQTLGDRRPVARWPNSTRRPPWPRAEEARPGRNIGIPRPGPTSFGGQSQPNRRSSLL
jgi:hypothetical protein